MGRWLIEAVAADIVGAKAAFSVLMRTPTEHMLLARSALAQIKLSQTSSEVQAIGLELAAITQNVEATLDLLKLTEDFSAYHGVHVPAFRRMVEIQRRYGNPQARRAASNI